MARIGDLASTLQRLKSTSGNVECVGSVIAVSSAPVDGAENDHSAQQVPRVQIRPVDESKFCRNRRHLESSSTRRWMSVWSAALPRPTALRP